ncbi:alanine dehydrogenase/PNT domain protein [Capnocytophaga ochracea DSM 7271]|uniref:alanine dehydrogenase n=1 Tax=Capnocytophaga ochracea (strain ATCC 27872 / DSM 7271 / CCUG 9716 / JCM 12966 / NCTC 12371 / SS31 / VPI 2845) TaxID=521097 RepID=C7M8V5_CAPOD|nr:alanine dehydrogenase [Capnocytophaga ochracea]ACU93484.1 alanine dehydrogenase/PNT domain protein [Capnocytophaga ochracea DSM 7271]UAK52170.1 alanine dehydrogenase [Capnocytophaga ochracea]
MESLSQLLPQEERLAVSNEQKSLKIGLPKEQTFQEHRICLTPDEVAVLVANGHQILIEAGAGEEAHFSDTDYSEAGAEIVYDTQEVFACPIVLKVQPPTTDELAYFNAQSVLLSALQLNTQDKTYFETLAQKQITALAFEYIKDEAENHPIQQSVDELTGIAAVLTASELLAEENRLLLGNITGIPPTEVVLLGANELTKAAAKTALGLGANVKIFAPSLTDLRKLRTHLPSSVYTATLQPQLLREALTHCHVLIGAMSGECRSPIVVTEEMVQQMKRGAVIVDASIGIGGCIETSKLTTLEQLTFTKYEVVHCGVPNLPSRYAHTASTLLSNILLSYLLKIGEEGGVENLLQIDKGFRNGLYSYHGILTHHNISKWFGLPYKPLHLLFL